MAKLGTLDVRQKGRLKKYYFKKQNIATTRYFRSECIEGEEIRGIKRNMNQNGRDQGRVRENSSLRQRERTIIQSAIYF